MTVEQLIDKLQELPRQSQVRFAEYDEMTGKTLRWYLGIACNTEH